MLVLVVIYSIDGVVKMSKGSTACWCCVLAGRILHALWGGHLAVVGVEVGVGKWIWGGGINLRSAGIGE